MAAPLPAASPHPPGLPHAAPPAPAQTVDPRQLQISLTGFLEKNTSLFCRELWQLLISATETGTGIPQRFLDEKAAEMKRLREEQEAVMARLKEAAEKREQEMRERAEREGAEREAAAAKIQAAAEENERRRKEAE